MKLCFIVDKDLSIIPCYKHWISIHSEFSETYEEHNYLKHDNYGSAKRQIQADTSRYKQIQADTTRYNQIQPDTTRYNQIQPDTNRYKQIQPDTTRYNLGLVVDAN
jgi:hypothetical protein